MKNHLSKIILGLFIIFSFANFVSASSCGPKTYNDYNSLDTNDGVIFVMSQPGDFYSDNYYDEDRYSTYEYRNGYTYRTSNDYYMHNTYVKYYGDYNSDYYSNNYAVYQKYPNQYYVYNDYMNTVEKHDCYIYPPRDDLFYVKCPGY